MTLRDAASRAETRQQPAAWEAPADGSPAPARARVAPLGPSGARLMGAGPSPFAGDIAAAGLEGIPGPRARAVPPTGLVSRHHAFLPADALAVRFGRPGGPRFGSRHRRAFARHDAPSRHLQPGEPAPFVALPVPPSSCACPRPPTAGASP